MSDNSVSSISIVKIGSVLIFMVALALLVFWKVRQYIKKRSSKSFGEKVEKMGEIVERSSTIQKIEIREKGTFGIIDGEEKSAVIEKHEPPQQKIKESVPASTVPFPVPLLDLLNPKDVTKITIEVGDKQYKFEAGSLEAKADGIFFWSKVIDSITKEKRYPMAGDRIMVDEIVAVIKKSAVSGKVFQRVTPNTPVMFIRFLFKSGQAVKKGQELALVAILKEKK